MACTVTEIPMLTDRTPQQTVASPAESKSALLYPAGFAISSGINRSNTVVEPQGSSIEYYLSLRLTSILSSALPSHPFLFFFFFFFFHEILCSHPEAVEAASPIVPTLMARLNFFEEASVWQEAPVLKGTTEFEPLPEVKNIMVTGGAGFM